MPRTLLLILPLMIASCVSIEKIAPPVDAAMVNTVAARGASSESLERGRMIYLNQCVACHTAEPVDRYSLSQWDRILPEMSKESKLSAAQSADVAAYVRAAHHTLTTVKSKP